MSKPHPIQPLELDERGVLRFKRNAILDYCVEQVGLNKLSAMFSKEEHAEDWSQLAQVIGYSHSGSPSYLDEEAWSAAGRMHNEGLSEAEARAAALRDLLRESEDRIGRAIEALQGDDE